jgi:hypothetical protein
MKFRKKPVEIEAIQFTGNNHSQVGDFLGWVDGWASPNEVVIETREGTMRGDVGDWIIKGVKGEFYPCKPDIFEATYEAIEE